MSAVTAPVRLTGRSTAVLVLVSLIGLALFSWPLFVPSEAALAHSADAPLVFAIVMTMLVIVLASEVISGELDAKGLAMLGVLAATAAALRPLGSGVSGFQPMFIVLIIGGRALGPGFGFSLGLVSMFGSALLTGGVGPWLPFQMLGAAWLGMGAGLLPRARGRRELILLAGYGAIAGVLYGFLLNLWFWPFLTTAAPGISFVAGAPIGENLGRFLVFCLVTSLGFDIPRAIGNVVLLLLAGGPMLRAIRRATRRANFSAVASFLEPVQDPDSLPDAPATADASASARSSARTTDSGLTRRNDATPRDRSGPTAEAEISQT